MIDEGNALREAIELVRGGRKRWRCPPDLRAAIVEYTRKQQANGRGHRGIAFDLGLSASTIFQWMRSSKSSFREVVVRPEVSSLPLTLVTPGGFRLEGLSEDFALRLVREL